MELDAQDKTAIDKIAKLSLDKGINVKGGRVRRTSSRFCLGVEHGDYFVPKKYTNGKNCRL